MEALERDGDSARMAERNGVVVCRSEQVFETSLVPEHENISVPVDEYYRVMATDDEGAVSTGSFSSCFMVDVNDIRDESLGNETAATFFIDLDDAWIAHSPDLGAELNSQLNERMECGGSWGRVDGWHGV